MIHIYVVSKLTGYRGSILSHPQLHQEEGAFVVPVLWEETQEFTQERITDIRPIREEELDLEGEPPPPSNVLSLVDREEPDDPTSGC